MKLAAVLLIIFAFICSSHAFPANGHPDDDAEVINGGSQTDTQPSVPTYPFFPSIPSYPSVPVYPTYGYTPAYPVHPTSYVPFAWSYNFFDSFGNFFNNLRNQASTAWSKVPSIRPLISNYWPETSTNANTTSTVKIVGDHKFVINETTHVQQSDFGHVIFKVRTVDIKPLTPGDERREETTPAPIPEQPNPNVEPEIFTDDDRTDVDETGDIDGNRGSPELLDDDNEIANGGLEHFEGTKTTESSEESTEAEKKPMNANIGIETFSVESNEEKMESNEEKMESNDQTSDEFVGLELDINDGSNQNTYYQVSNDESGGEEQDLTNDIAINQMLADQGAPHDPDAEVFDISQFDVSRVSSQETEEVQPESFDYLPYHHTANQRTSAIK